MGECMYVQVWVSQHKDTHNAMHQCSSTWCYLNTQKRYTPVSWLHPDSDTASLPYVDLTSFACGAMIYMQTKVYVPVCPQCPYIRTCVWVNINNNSKQSVKKQIQNYSFGQLHKLTPSGIPCCWDCFISDDILYTHVQSDITYMILHTSSMDIVHIHTYVHLCVR